MSSALLDTLAQRALTADLSLGVRLILPVDCLVEVEMPGSAQTVGAFIHKTGHGHTRATSKIGGCVVFGQVPNDMLQLA